MELGLMIIFWYGVLHAFAPDHLSVIADFSIGKSIKKTLSITIAFAVGHGLMLFVFAKLLTSFALPSYITDYGDVVSSSIIIAIGVYLLFMVYANRIQLHAHEHNGERHMHIWFGDKHSHGKGDTLSVLGIGALMGIGGVRGMMVTLGMIESGSIDLSMIVAFVFGVSIIFLLFGVSILYVNRTFLTSQDGVRRVFALLGIVSVGVGTNMILA